MSAPIADEVAAVDPAGRLPDVDDLRVFVAVAREGNASRAAASLHLSQPAVSLRLQRLADRLGVALFRRRSHGLALTEDGAALLPAAEQALASLVEIDRSAATRRQEVRGLIRIGTILDPAFTRLGAFLKALNGLAPAVQPDLRHGISGTVERQILAEKLDAGFVLGPPEDFDGPGRDDRLLRLPLTRFRYRVVAPRGWQARVTGRGWVELAALPWLETPAESVHHRLLQAVFRPLGVRPQRVALVDQESSMLDLVRSGVCLALARDAIAIAESQQSGLAVADQVAIDCVLGFASLASRRDEPGIDRAFRAIGQVWR